MLVKEALIAGRCFDIVFMDYTMVNMHGPGINWVNLKFYYKFIILYCIVLPV